jgi:hypothetical protein
LARNAIRNSFDEKRELREEVRIKKEETGNRSGGKKVEGKRKN